TEVFMAQESSPLPGVTAGVILVVVVLAGIAGLIVERRAFQFDPAARAAMRIFLFYFAPVFFLKYLVQFFAFSEYPFTDLYQKVHILKGATQFARFDILNPFTAN